MSSFFFQNVIAILEEDNLKAELSFFRRHAIEKDIFLLDNKSLLFQVCTLNFLRACLDGCYSNTFAYCHSLSTADATEIKILLQVRKGKERTLFILVFSMFTSSFLDVYH